MEVDILIVEDDKNWMKLFEGDAKQAGLSCLSCQSLDTAFDAIEHRRFNAAIVDMSLTGDNYTVDRGGEKVVRVIDGLAEGTQMAVVSAHTGSTLASKLGMLFGTPLIQKRSRTVDDMSAIMQRMVEVGKGNRPRPANAQVTLRGGMSGVDWEILLSNSVPEARGGAGFMNKFIAQAAAHFTPLTESKTGGGLTRVRQGVLGGEYWSRREGRAVQLLVGMAGPLEEYAAERGVLVTAGSRSDPVLSRRAQGVVESVVYSTERPRDEFAPVTWLPEDDEQEAWLESIFGDRRRDQ